MKILLSQLTLHNKLIASFALMLCILTMLGISVIVKLASVNEETSTVVREVQPVLIAAEELNAEMVEAASNPGFYMLDKNSNHLKKYVNQFTHVETTLAFLSASENTDPLAMEASQQLSKMIQVEEKEEATSDRKHILADLNNLHYAWSNTINEMVDFFKIGSSVAAYSEVEREKTERPWGKLAATPTQTTSVRTAIDSNSGWVEF